MSIPSSKTAESVSHATNDLDRPECLVNSAPEGGKRPIRYGLLKGKIWIADDFDAPLPPDILDDFERE